MNPLPWTYDDGGRVAAGYEGKAGDCVTRAIAVASGRPYADVYMELASLNARMPRSKRRRRGQVGVFSARHGIYTKSKLFKDYMEGLGFYWVATMRVGSGCKVHLRRGELPMGRLVTMVSKHACAVIDGVVHDTYDCTRDGTRCVYGYYTLTEPQA